MLCAQTRIIPIKPANRVKAVTRQQNGDLLVEQYSGESFVVKKDDELFQAFCVYTVLADL